mmetsp:Transcript_8958/g.24983  ORF Transcript_8958/g.24983 Transcript_8958/m.24983 type:complete len:222 (-) Transcript_8958:35-700(-)
MVSVTYFAGRGRAEFNRNILAAAGVKFENISVREKKDLVALRESGVLTYGQIPVVQIDGLNLVQGFPTAQYLGTKYNLYPSDPKDQYLVAHVWSASEDARTPILYFYFGDRDVGQLMATLNDSKGLLGRHAPAWESLVVGPFLLGAAANIADIKIFELLDFLKDIIGDAEFGEALAPFPKLLALYSSTFALGRLRTWCEVERATHFATPDDYVAQVKASTS